MASFHKSLGPSVELLLFPSDEFGGQELPAAKVPAFVSSQGLPVNAPGCRLFAKVNTNGPSMHPVYKLCKEAFPGDVRWNFASSFLFDKEGKCVKRYDQSMPDEAALRALL